MVLNSIRLKVALAAGALLLAVVALAAPAPVVKPTEPLTDAEKAGVTTLHRTTVEVFIDRPNFGMRRMPLRVDDLITYPKPVPKKDGDDKDKKPQGAPVQLPAEEKAKQPHFTVQDLTGNDGLFRLVTEDKKEVWKVRKIQLVGLVKHPEPVVYLTDKMPEMKEAKEVPTRELDAFEKTALVTLKGGENLKAEKSGKEMRVMGPIYAGARCVACHETKGQMLGAFTYELEKVPYDAEKDKAPSPFPRLPRE